MLQPWQSLPELNEPSRSHHCHARLAPVPTNVWDAGTDIAEDNPLGKIPALFTDSGHILYDSPVICEYLDSLHDGANLFPSAGGARWTALRRQALADGILDAGVGRRLESRRPEDEQSANWIKRYQGVVARGLDALEGEASDLQDRITIGHIAIGCMLGWLEFRFPDEDWAGRPTGAQGLERGVLRPSVNDVYGARGIGPGPPSRAPSRFRPAF